MLQKLLEFPANSNNTTLTTANMDCRTSSNSQEQSDTFYFFNKSCDEVFRSDKKRLTMAFQETSEEKNWRNAIARLWASP